MAHQLYSLKKNNRAMKGTDLGPLSFLRAYSTAVGVGGLFLLLGHVDILILSFPTVPPASHEYV